MPKYYNPAAVNPLKYAEQVQKRKLLWSKNKEKKPVSTVSITLILLSVLMQRSIILSLAYQSDTFNTLVDIIVTHKLIRNNTAICPVKFN